MIDIKIIRDNPEMVKEHLINKNSNIDIDLILELDKKKRALQHDFDSSKAHQKRISKQIPLMKKKGEDTGQTLAEMQKVAAQIKKIGTELSQVNSHLQDRLIAVPNVFHNSVPLGKSADDNVVIKEHGKDFFVSEHHKQHHIIANELGLLDLERGAKISGSGFPVHRREGAMLERALINFMLDFHCGKHHYEEVTVPVLVTRNSMTGTGQLPKLEDDMYLIKEDDMFLIPTGEVPVTNLYAGEIMPAGLLPLKLVTCTPCFRREAGSYGKDTKGLQRIHQFNKVELVRFVKPADSYDALEEMTCEAESILEALGLPYRRVLLCSGDMSFASSKTYDLEVWAPGANKFLEVSSLSNFEDFQARRAGIRFRDEKGKAQYAHTLNGSGLATPRTFIAILENYQNQDGSINVPLVLRPYMNGIEKIG